MRVAVVLVAAFWLGASVLTDCLPETTNPDRMACCKDKQHDCGGASVAVKCCVSQHPSARQLVVAQTTRKLAPVFVVAHLGTAVPSLPDLPSLKVLPDFAGNPSPPPRFLLNVTLRI